MSKIKTIPEKLLNSVYSLVRILTAGRCAICGSMIDVQQHHKLENSKNNRKLFPLFIDSPINRISLCSGMSEKNCHQNIKHNLKINEREAEVIEWYLEEMVMNSEKHKKRVQERHDIYGKPCERW